MARALWLALKGWGQTKPNPMVGAVIVQDDEIVGEGFHARAGEPHAEVLAIRDAGKRARGGTLYVNLEPCNHHGRTPPCTESIISAGITHVVAATTDPNPEASGGAGKLRENGITVDIGVLEAEAREINASWIASFALNRPYITLKLAVSLDGAIADAKRSRGWLTGTEARAEVQRLRAVSDGVAVGIATAIADDPLLTARVDPPPVSQPARIVFDRHGRLSPTSALARTAHDVPTIIVTTTRAKLLPDLEFAGVQQIAAHNLDEALKKLKERGINSLLVEGGAGVTASFLAEGVVDRMIIFQAPIVLGAGSLGAFSGIAPHDLEHAPHFHALRTERFGDDVMTVYSPSTS
ncbi:MAG TPA: bifunctional diaminohydroxyphosphoribosylaminopyrimidine deaminase/5-amino-6-(5-phosphoribosylamino)uracil reductase RibD [Gemmatimonadaceae bacterium]|nr:bifunctional diaminohydroxyphosphoribosylaminopyrimidine deaminase/5-amino-6-(5-phosphoribosylamino)uracil reductase RibD [Gemmatimonadaceae bacterium]